MTSQDTVPFRRELTGEHGPRAGLAGEAPGSRPRRAGPRRKRNV